MAVTSFSAEATRTFRWGSDVIDGLLDLTPEQAPLLFGDLRRSPRRWVLEDEAFHELYGDSILALLERYDVEHNTPFVLPGGEAAKSWEWAERILDSMEEFGISRFDEDALGFCGGVGHDVLGTVAGLQRRGINYRIYATTLLCAIDAMFALKTALNTRWKNRVGLYWPATYSATDLAFYGTLSHEDILLGTAEIIKWALADRELWDLIERHGPRLVRERYQGSDDVARTVVCRTIGGMLNGELEPNALELDPARRSYIGHSISQGWEPDLPHGFAVISDILVGTMIAWRLGGLPAEARDRIVDTIERIGFPLWHPVMEEEERAVRALADTILHRGGRQLFPVPWGAIGQIDFVTVTSSQLQQALADVHARAGRAHHNRPIGGDHG